VAPLLEAAAGLPDQVVKPFVVAVYGVTGAPHGRLDVLDREESCAPPVRGMRFFFGHGGEPLRCTARASPEERSRVALSERGRRSARTCSSIEAPMPMTVT
jgi:hypothetical protein